jgi:uncharacterized protein (DUF2141 family)
VKRFPGLKTLAVLLISLFAGACAVDRPPTGGPPDTTPLAVVASSPEPGTVNVSPRVIRIEFNRFVTSGALLKAIFFSPVIKDYQIRTHGREAEIRIYSPLKQGRTYTLTLRKSLKSYYGTELARSWTLPFSTGPVLDIETLEGKVWTRLMAPASNISVLAYALTPSDAVPPDTLASVPDYMTQTDASGNFRFESLSKGAYRLVALRDKNSNFRFDPGKDEFGVTPTPSVATGATGITFRLSEADTAAVAIRSARAISQREVEVAFNRSIPTRSLAPAAFNISDKSKGTTLSVLGCFSLNRSEEENTFRLLTGAMDQKSLYTISYTPQDVPIRKKTVLEFLGSSHVVTYPNLAVTIVPSDKTVNALLEMVRPDAGPCIELQFNLPVEAASVRRAVTLSTVRKTGEQEAPSTLSGYDSRTWTLQAVGGFAPGTDYLVKVRPTLVTTLTGTKGKDSLMVSRFSTAGPDQYGEIIGTGSSEASEIVVEVRREGTSSTTRTVVRPSAGGAFSYAFRGLPPGNYTVSAFVPAASRSVTPMSEWQPGSVTPFRPSEPFTAITAVVKPGWTTEAVLPRIAARLPQQETVPAKPAKTSGKASKRKRH